MEGNEKVRLLGIDAPEKGERCFEESKKFLEDLLLNKGVELEFEKEKKDLYGRTLAYVFYNSTLINSFLVKNGLAYSYMITGLRYEEEIRNAEKFAREGRIGCLWK